ncbi:MAG: endonuclease NucS [Candidatus Woesearchaeota archaeon]
MEKFKARLENALSNNHTIVFSARCTVDYKGRAEAFLPEGDRFVIIKSDKALLVHQPQGNTPVNYMKPGSRHTLILDDDSCTLLSENHSLKEYLEIAIKDIHFLESRKLDDNSKLSLAGNERDMSDHLFENPELVEPGFKPVSREEQTKYGFLDLWGKDENGILTVVECKRYLADLAAVTQLRRYVERMEHEKKQKVRGILAAPKISANAKKMLEDWGFRFSPVDPPLRLKRDQSQQNLFEY